VTLPSVTVGDALPELVLDLDRTTVVAAAIASQDFEDVHHDPGKAAERGMRDIFLSINSTNGFVDRYVTDWAGPDARLTKVALRLGVPQFPGEPLTFIGVVTSLEDCVSVRVEGRNSIGVHVTADVSLVDHRSAS